MTLTPILKKFFREIANIEIAPVLHCRENRITKTHIIRLYTICCVCKNFHSIKKVKISFKKKKNGVKSVTKTRESRNFLFKIQM